jgi:hypothetical protein
MSILQLVGLMVLTAAVGHGLAGTTGYGESPFADALAAWHMDHVPVGAGPFSPLKTEVHWAGMPLTGEQLTESLVRGGDGKVAEFESGLLLSRDATTFANNALTIHLRAEFAQPVEGDGLLLQCGEGNGFLFRLYRRLADHTEAVTYFRQFRPDGECPVLEFEIRYPKTCIFRVATPLVSVGETGWQDITIRYSGARIELLIDGVPVDEEWPIGDITGDPANRLPEVVMSGGERFHVHAARAENQKSRISDTASAVAVPFRLDHLAVWNRALSDAEVTCLCGGKERIAARTQEVLGPEPTNMQYWTPRGFNAWVGDTMCLYHEGRFHLFYLLDRRHGWSKYKVGAHQIAHMSSADLTRWEHHPMAVGVEEQWEAIGTGWPFIHGGTWYLSYGMCTDRLMPQDQTAMPLFDEALASAGSVRPMKFEDVMAEGRWPVGGAYAVSDDGIDFRKQRVMMHLSQNPTVVPGGEGSFYMCAGYPQRKGHGGVWESTDLLAWEPSAKKLPAWYECTCLFEWNGWGYAIGGRHGFAVSRDGFLGPYRNAPGTVYDGLMVPMVGAFKDNRRVLAGFMAFEGYAGYLVFRELIQHGDGSLGMKWPEEMRPKTGQPIALAPPETPDGTTVEQDGVALKSDTFAWVRIPDLPQSFHLSVRVTPEPGAVSFGLGMYGREALHELAKDASYRWQLRIPTDIGWQLRFMPALRQVQWETPQKHAPRPSAMDLSENRPCAQGNFAIHEVNGIDRSFLLEMIVRYDAKSDRSIIDAMINNERTMITSRHLAKGESPLFLYAHNGHVRFDQIRVRPLIE